MKTLLYGARTVLCTRPLVRREVSLECLDGALVGPQTLSVEDRDCSDSHRYRGSLVDSPRSLRHFVGLHRDTSRRSTVFFASSGRTRRRGTREGRPRDAPVESVGGADVSR